MEREKQDNVMEQNDAEEVVEVVEEHVTIDEETEQLSQEQQTLMNLESQLSEANNRLLRVQADYDNFRRRSREEKEAALKYRAQALVEELLPVLDNFERALGVQVEQPEAKSILQGMDMVYRQFQDALKKEGLESIESVGQTFDPHQHQAIMQVEVEDYDSNQVVEELQKGYKLKDRVLRPAMVKVNQ